MKSILTGDLDSCYICGRPREAIHHCFEGTARRKISDDNDFIVPLCNYHHNMSDDSVHFNRRLALKVKQDCQRKYEENHTREEFIKLIGRNYL